MRFMANNKRLLLAMLIEWLRFTLRISFALWVTHMFAPFSTAARGQNPPHHTIAIPSKCGGPDAKNAVYDSMSLDMIRKLVSRDSHDPKMREDGIKAEIKRRGIKFSIDETALDELRKLKVGEQTISLLKAWREEKPPQVQLDSPRYEVIHGDDLHVCVNNYDNEIGEPLFYWDTLSTRLSPVPDNGRRAIVPTKDFRFTPTELASGKFTFTLMVTGIDRKGRSFTIKAEVLVWKRLNIRVEPEQPEVLNGYSIQLTAKPDEGESKSIWFHWYKNGKEIGSDPRISIPTIDIGAINVPIEIEILLKAFERDEQGQTSGQASKTVRIRVLPSAKLLIDTDTGGVHVKVGGVPIGTYWPGKQGHLYVAPGEVILVEATKQGYMDWMKSMKVEAGKQYPLYISMKKLGLSKDADVRVEFRSIQYILLW